MERVEEAKRWFLQALRDLEAARNSLRSGYYEWACFQAQQSAEKAIKALLHALGVHAWGHSIVELLGLLEQRPSVPEKLLIYGREPDRHYIHPHYPNAFEPGYPRCTTMRR